MSAIPRRQSASELMADVARAIAMAPAIVSSIPKVYAFYLAYRAQKGLQGPDPENIIASVGEIQTVGDCRHAIEITDTSGTKYLVTVEVLPRAAKAVR